MLHKMKLKESPFERIKNGTKTVEFRLYDEKRRKIKIGDQIEFSKLPELEEKILVNGKVESNNYLVNIGDIISVNDELDFDIHLKAQDIPIDIVYENDDLLIINKASGMVVHPAPGNYDNTLVNALLGKFSLSNDNLRPGIVHRLDKDTSGLMLVAKNDWAHDKLSEMINNPSN